MQSLFYPTKLYFQPGINLEKAWNFGPTKKCEPWVVMRAVNNNHYDCMYSGWSRGARLTHSLEKVVPILVLQFENYPLFAAKHWLFNLKWPLFCHKTLIFQPKWTPIFTVKHWTSKLTPFSPNLQRWVAKYTLYLGKCESWISSKNTPLFANFRTGMGVVKQYEWGSWGVE